MSANDYQFSPPECHDVKLSALRQYANSEDWSSVRIGSYVVVSHAVVFGDYRYYARPYVECVCSNPDEAEIAFISIVDGRSRYESEFGSPYRFGFEIWHVVPDVVPDVVPFRAAPLLSDGYLTVLHRVFLAALRDEFSYDEFADVMAHV